MKSVFDVEILEKNGQEAFEEVLNLREKIAESRRYPFIMGGEKSLGLLTDTYQYHKLSPAEIIEKAQTIDVKELFERLKQNSLPVAEETEFDISMLTGSWEYLDSNRDIGLEWDDLVSGHKDILTRKFLDKCFVGIAPTVESWQVPAFVKFGSWNACPSPEEHCAILRFWQEKYGAQIISLTGDVIECSVSHPPQTEEECFEIAWQQYVYCSDIVDQGVGTVGALASILRNSSYWYFWWD